jgi:DNA polymerase III sliding clamp (beta) subunit (PCNA family)
MSLHTFTKKHSPEFNYISFVALAISKDPIKHNITVIKSFGDRIVATDSHRMHQYKTYILPVGTYKVIKKTKSEITLVLHDADEAGTFPDVDRLIPEMLDGVELVPTVPGAHAQIIRAMTVNHINYDYLKDALSTDDALRLQAGDGSGPVLLKSDNITAVIMPMRA